MHFASERKRREGRVEREKERAGGRDEGRDRERRLGGRKKERENEMAKQWQADEDLCSGTALKNRAPTTSCCLLQRGRV